MVWPKYAPVVVNNIYDRYVINVQPEPPDNDSQATPAAIDDAEHEASADAGDKKRRSGWGTVIADLAIGVADAVSNL